MPRTAVPERDELLSEVDDLLDIGSGQVRGQIRLTRAEPGAGPIGRPTDRDLDLINRQAIEPLGADEVFVFRNEISSDLLDSYFTRMDPDTTLPNFMHDFREGRSLQNSHNFRELPLGRSYDADLTRESDPERTSVRVSTYILRGVATTGISVDDVIRQIRAGIVKDMSVRFTGGEFICSICGLDMWRDWDCPHWPGQEYTVGEEGKRTELCTARIVNAHASEHSLVFDGATPMAMILKGQDLVERGVLSGRALQRFQQIYRCRMRGGLLVPDSPSARRALQESLDMVRKTGTTRAARTAPKTPPPAPEPAPGDAGSSARELATTAEEFAAFSMADKLRIYEMARILGFITAAGEVAPERESPSDEERMWRQRAEWSTEYVNDLPDSAFAYIEPGGEKDEDGKTTPRSLRHFPHHNDGGTPDEDHVRNALARIPQSDVSEEGKEKALAHIESHAKEMGIEVSDDKEKSVGDPTPPTATTPPVTARSIVDLLRLPQATRQVALRALLSTLNGECNRGLADAVLAEITKRYGATISAATAEQLNEIADHLADAGQIIEELLDAAADAGGGDDDDPDEEEEDEPGGDEKGRGQRSDPVPTADTAPTPDAGRVPGAPVELRTVMRVWLDLTTEEGAPEGTAEERAARRASLVAEVERRADLSPLREVMRQASDGRRLRGLLIEEAHEWGARARGNTYHRALYDRMLAQATVDDIREHVRDMEQEAYRRFANENPGETPSWTPSLAGQVGRASTTTQPYGPRTAVPTPASAPTAAALFKDQQPLRRS